MKRNNLFKRFALVAMSLVMALSMIACGDKDKKSSGDPSVVSSVSSSAKGNGSETSVSNEQKQNNDGHDWPFMAEENGLRYVAEVYTKCEDLCDWGNYDRFRFSNTWIYVKFPTLIHAGSNFVAYQTDDTAVLFYALFGETFNNEVTDLESILTAGINNPTEVCSPVKLLNDYWSLYAGATCTITVDNTSLETVGQYDCCKYTGNINYVGYIDELEHNVPFVAYATFTKNENYPIYWMVLDESEDHSFGETIEDYAKKMGYTIVEDTE